MDFQQFEELLLEGERWFSQLIFVTSVFTVLITLLTGLLINYYLCRALRAKSNP